MNQRKEKLFYAIGLCACLVGAVICLLLAKGMETNAAETKNVEENTDTWIDDTYQQDCETIGRDMGISSELLEAVIEQESWGVAEVFNGDCKGLMQVNEKYHNERMKRLGITDIFDPYGNILTGADYLLELFRENEDIGTVLMIYNGTKDAKERGAHSDYTTYARQIMERTEQLERIHDK